MPYLNKDNKKGFLYCLFGQKSSVPDALGKLNEYLGKESLTIKTVTRLFQKFDDATFECDYPKKLLLVEKLKFKKHTILEVCDIFQTNVYTSQKHHAFFIQNILPDTGVFDCFKHGHGMDEFCETLSDELMRRKLNVVTEWNYYTRDFLNGFIRCLKYQGRDLKEIHEEFKKLTLREAYTLEDVAEVIDFNEDVLVEKGYDFSMLPEHIVDRYLGYTDVNSRVHIRNTCKTFNESIDSFIYDIDSIHVNFGNKLLRIVGIDDVDEKQYQILDFKTPFIPYRKHCLIHENGNVWLELDIKKDHFCRKFKNFWESLRNSPRKELKEFKLSFEDDFRGMEMVTWMFEELGQLPVDKLFIYCGGTELPCSIIKKFRPCGLQKVAIYSSNESIRDYFSTSHLFGSDTYISNTICNVRVLHVLWLLKFARIRVATVTTQQIIALKSMILTKSDVTSDRSFREVKIEMDHMPDNVYDALNIEFETFNQRDTANPRYAEFPFSEPNQDKKLKVALYGNICWFRGPACKHGEMEAAEKELDSNLARTGSKNGIPMHGTCFSKKSYTRAKGFELEAKDFFSPKEEGEKFEQEVLPEPVEAVAEEMDSANDML